MLYNRNMKKLSFYIATISAPFIASAAIDTGSSDDIESLLKNISRLIINPIINFLLVIATLVFLWGVIQYVIAGESSDKTQKAKQQIIWGLIGLTIMASAWAIVKIIKNSVLGV
jgi:hypothetical protein